MIRHIKRARLLSRSFLLGTRQTWVAATVCLLSTFSMSSAYAGLPVTDIGNLVTHWSNKAFDGLQQGEQSAEFATEIKRWNDVRKQYATMLGSVQSLMFSLNLPLGAKMQKVPEDYLVLERCSEAKSGFSPATLMKTFVPSATDDAAAKQRKICAQIQMIQNRKYNETVDFLDTTVADIKKSQQSDQTRRDTFDASGAVSPGAMSAHLYDTEDVRSKMASRMDEYKQRMRAYDSFIATQRDVQGLYATMMLKGQPGLVGQLGKTAVLKAALSVN